MGLNIPERIDMTSSSLSEGRSNSDMVSDNWLYGDIAPDRALSVGLRAVTAWMSENGDCMRDCGRDGTGAARVDKGERV